MQNDDEDDLDEAGTPTDENEQSASRFDGESPRGVQSPPARTPGCWSRGALLLGSIFIAVLAAGSGAEFTDLRALLAVAAMVVLIPTSLLAFPAGLTLFFERLFSPQAPGLSRPEGNQTLGCLIYSLLALMGMFVRDRRWFWSIFGVWIGLLMVNVAGCQPMIDWTFEQGFGASPPKNRNP